MKYLSRTLLPALLCAATVPSTCEAKWSLLARLKVGRSCQVVSPCSTACAPQLDGCQPINVCDPIAQPTEVFVENCCGNTLNETVGIDAYVVEPIDEGMPSETISYESVSSEGVMSSEAPIPVVESPPEQVVASVESGANDQALVEAEKSLKKAQSVAKKAKADLAAAQKESAAALAAAQAASQEQIEKLRTQNANLKKNLDTARARIERMQSDTGSQQAKREDEPTAKAASDSQSSDKKPGAKKSAASKAAKSE